MAVPLPAEENGQDEDQQQQNRQAQRHPHGHPHLADSLLAVGTDVPVVLGLLTAGERGKGDEGRAGGGDPESLRPIGRAGGERSEGPGSYLQVSGSVSCGHETKRPTLNEHTGSFKMWVNVGEQIPCPKEITLILSQTHTCTPPQPRADRERLDEGWTRNRSRRVSKDDDEDDSLPFCALRPTPGQGRPAPPRPGLQTAPASVENKFYSLLGRYITCKGSDLAASSSWGSPKLPIGSPTLSSQREQRVLTS